MPDIKPEDFKELTELEKQHILYDDVEQFVDNFLSEYTVSEISVVGVLHRLVFNLQEGWVEDEYEED